MSKALEAAMAMIISSFDSNYKREGLIDTPRRYLKFLNEFLNPPDFDFTTFNKENHDQMVVVKDIPFYSLCEHHLAPFFGFGAIAYIPNLNGRICGLSKLPRTLDLFSRRLQNQERITDQTAEYIMEKLEPRGVGVALYNVEHLCMAMRGVKKSGTKTITTALRGNFNEPSVKQEFLNWLQ
jgi:GTP cyclohydrolase I